MSDYIITNKKGARCTPQGVKFLEEISYYLSHFPTLETDRLILRAKSAADSEDMKTYMADEKLYKYWGRSMTRKEKEPSLFFQRNINSKKKDHISWGIELKKNRRLVGEVNLFSIENERQAMLGYRIASAYQGMGFVTEALRRVVRFCFEETSLQRLEAEVMTVNVASNRVMEKCGFTCEGTKRQAKFVSTYADFNIYGLLKSDIMGEKAASFSASERVKMR